jgi:hypothetical protein
MKLNSFGMNLYPKRYENTTRVFLKNSGFSYLYGSISYLFGYEKNRCFSLMLVLFVMHIVEYCSPMGGWCAKSPQFSWV